MLVYPYVGMFLYLFHTKFIMYVIAYFADIKGEYLIVR